MQVKGKGNTELDVSELIKSPAVVSFLVFVLLLVLLLF